MTQPATAYVPAATRYDTFSYRPAGRSGLKLPPLSLGLWHNFGDDTPLERQREILRAAFDLGITHFDLANNYGTPYGSAETNFGRLLKEDFRAHRDELIVSTKAGWDMWPGPYGQGGGSRKYVLASLDQSLRRMGLDYVDIFYSHRFDPQTPLEETAFALATVLPAYTRSANNFNRWFGPDRYKTQKWYAGNHPAGSNENFYGLFTFEGRVLAASGSQLSGGYSQPAPDFLSGGHAGPGHRAYHLSSSPMEVA